MKYVFMLSEGDNSLIDIYSTPVKAITAARARFTARNLTMSGSQAAIELHALRKKPTHAARMIATEATDCYDLAKTLIIEKWRVQ